MKKLYIVFDQIPNGYSGGLITTYLNLVKLLDRDYDIHIISIFDCDEVNKDLFQNYPIHIIYDYNIDIRFFRLFSYLFKNKDLKGFINGIRSTIIYFFTRPMIKARVKKILKNDDRVIVSSPSAAAFMPKKVKFILEIHTKYEYFFGNNFLGKMQIFLMTKPELILFRSKADANKAIDKFNVSYIYNTIDVEKNQREKDYNCIKNKILFVGRLSVEKNIPRLLKVAKALKNMIPEIVLDIYGTGDIKESIEKEIKNLKLENNVFLKGFTADKEIYHNYSVFVLTSDVEGFPLTIIEAKANGTPTITIDWGEAVYEIVNNEVDGYIVENEVEMAKKLELLLSDDELLKLLSKNALNNFNKFSREEARNRWLEILK